MGSLVQQQKSFTFDKCMVANLEGEATTNRQVEALEVFAAPKRRYFDRKKYISDKGTTRFSFHPLMRRALLQIEDPKVTEAKAKQALSAAKSEPEAKKEKKEKKEKKRRKEGENADGEKKPKKRRKEKNDETKGSADGIMPQLTEDEQVELENTRLREEMAAMLAASKPKEEEEAQIEEDEDEETPDGEKMEEEEEEKVDETVNEPKSEKEKSVDDTPMTEAEKEEARKDMNGEEVSEEA